MSEVSADKKKRSSGAVPASFLYGYLIRYKWVFFPAFGALILTAGLSLAFPYFLGSLIGSPSDALAGAEIDVESLQKNINRTVITLVCILFIQAIVGFFRVQGFIKAGEAALNNIRQDVLSHLLRLPIPFFHQHRAGELSGRLSGDLEILRETLMTTVPQFARQVVILIGGLIFLFCSSVKLSLFMLALIPVIVLAIAILGKSIKGFSRASQDALSKSNVVAEEAISGIQELKGNVNESFESKRYKAVLDEFKEVAYKGAKARALFVAFIIFALFGSISVVAWFGAGMLSRGEIATEEFVRFILFSVFVGASLGAMPEIFSQIAKADGATERIREILAMKPEVSIEQSQELVIPDLQGQVTFENISFAYPSRPDSNVLRDVSFNVEVGQRIAIVGASGAGKSTLFQLLLGFYNPDLGHLKIDGKLAQDYELSTRRASMSLVPQDIFLFGGTISENILYGSPNSSEEEMIEAAKQAYAHDFICDFAEGYETMVGQRGVKLSGGQRQRIAIARAILANPRILLLDEATSALDAESEKYVQEALNKLMESRTSIVIAHRLATIRSCDKIYVLEHGEILESGTHEELVALGQRYKYLAETQFIA